MRCCGSRSSASRPNSPTLARPGPRPPAPCISTSNRPQNPLPPPRPKALIIEPKTGRVDGLPPFAHSPAQSRAVPAGSPMPLRLDSRSPDFEARFRDFLNVKREASQDVETTVRGIIADVAARGDKALIELTQKIDRGDLSKVGLRVRAAELDAAEHDCERKALDALALARDRIEAYHRRQKPQNTSFTDALGVELGSRWTPIEAVGLYVP